MSIFEAADYDDHERVLFVNEPESGLRAIIAIHNTNMGPALGGCRMWPYESESAAISDVLRLSRGMTYKAAMARVRLGGGKSVILGDSRTAKTPRLLHAMGRAIASLQGRYIVGEDIGTNPLDMREIRTQAQYVSCLRQEDGGYGDPAPMTALGVWCAIRAGVRHRSGSDDLRGLRVAVQGAGNVGQNLCRLLAESGARITVCDVHEPSVQSVAQRYDAAVVPPDSIYDVDADVFAPCAMGAVLSARTIPRLRVAVVAGAANNQLATNDDGQRLADRGITYLPDYVANGGGLISCAAEWYRDDMNRIRRDVLGIQETCSEILARAASLRVPTNVASDQIARERFSRTA